MNRCRSPGHRIAVTLLSMIVATAAAADPSSHSLRAAADTLASRLPLGQIVTAEQSGDAPPLIYAAGESESPDVPPADRIFEIGSITKVFTGLLLAQAVVEKRVTLDATLGDLLGPDQKFGDPRVAAISLRQLATHTSGLPRLPANLERGADPTNPYAHYDWDLLARELKTTKLTGNPPFPPAYSNFGFGLLGEIIARVFQKSWADLVREKISEPLGLADTTVRLDADQRVRFVPPHDGDRPAHEWTFDALAGAGALRSTAADLVRFGWALRDPEATPLREAITLLLTPQTPDGTFGLGIETLKIDGRTVFQHAGGTGGYRSVLRVIPETNEVQVVLINNTTIEAGAMIVAARGEKPRSDEGRRTVTVDQLDACVGVYAVEGGRFTIVRDGNRLMAQLTGQVFLPLFPHETPDRFFYRAVPAEIQFHRSNDGDITSLTLFQNGAEVVARRETGAPPPVIFRTADELAPFAGIYELAPGVMFTVKVTAATLHVQLTGQSSLPVFERRPDRFEYDVLDAALVFERDTAGKITALVLHQHGLQHRAVRKNP